ncbi:MAG: radical SAM protein [Thermodesulfobacteriota bacterium]
MSSLNEKKVLLVHPLGYRLDQAEGDISRMTNIMPPLGLASIAAYLDEHGFASAIIDCYAQPANSDQLIKAFLEREKPAHIAFSCTTSSFLDGVRLARLAKELLPGITSVFGGVHVSALKEKALTDYAEVDLVVVGEGEETLREVMTSPADKRGEVAQLIWRDETGQVIFNDQKRAPLDLDSLPFPAYEKLADYPGAYQLPIFNYPKEPNSSCISSRGCPYACSYCDRSVFRRSFRYNSADYLYRHLAYLKEKFGIRHINFYDDQFTFNRERVEEFCQRMIDAPLGMTYNCAVRAEHIDFELLTLMKRAGCWMISLGIETGDENLLAQHRQNADLAMLAEKIRLIDKAGIRVKGLLMMGLPGESEASIKKSMDYVFSLPIADFNLAKFTPFPGSPIYKSIHELGEFEEDWAKMDCMDFLFIPNGMQKERMEELFINFYKSHYQRPKVLWGYVTMLWKSPSSWRRFATNIFSFLSFIRSSKRLENK